MSTELQTVSEVIDALGGLTATAELTGYKPNAVGMWRMRGRFPPDSYLLLHKRISRRLAPRGLSVPSSLWGMKETAEI